MLPVAIHCQKNRNDRSTYDREHAAIYIICTLMVQYMYIFHMAMSSNGGQHQQNEYNMIIHFECTIVDVICTGLSCSANCNSVESLVCAYCTYVRNTH